MATTFSDALPEIEVLSGRTIAPNNPVHVRGFFWRVVDGTKRRDETGPVRGFLALSNASNAPAANALLKADATHHGDGKWSLVIGAEVLNPLLCQRTFKVGQPVFLHIVQDGASHTTVQLTYQLPTGL